MVKRNLIKNSDSKYGFIPLGTHIQMFASEGDSEQTDVKSNEEVIETYSKEEYESLKSQLQKIKDSNNKLSSELAQKKKAEREKLSQEEQEAEARKEKDVELENLRNELNSIKMRSELNNCGIEEKQASSLIEAINGGDKIELSKTISSIIKAQVEKKEKEMKQQNQHTQHYPQPSSEKLNTMDDFMKRRIESRKK